MATFGSVEHREKQSKAIKEALARKKATGWVNSSRRSTGKSWKVNNRASIKHECIGIGCTNGRHKTNSGSFQIGYIQTNPKSLENLKVWRDQQREWKNGTSYEGQFTYTLRAQVWLRDCNTCQDCEIVVNAGEMSGVVHHVDFDKSHNELKKLILLCRSCHIKRHDRDFRGRIVNLSIK